MENSNVPVGGGWRNELNDEERDWLRDDMMANDADFDTEEEEDDDE
jgi:hypothetical protein